MAGFDDSDDELYAQILCRTIGEETCADPLFKQYLSERAATPVWKNTQPWHAKAEQSAVIVAIASGTDLVGGLEGFSPSQRISLLDALIRSTPYLWSLDVDRMIKSSPPLPPHVIARDILVFPYSFWAFEKCYYIEQAQEGQENKRHGSWNWMSLFDGIGALEEGDPLSDGVILFLDADKGSKVNIFQIFLPYGAKWPDDFPVAARSIIEFTLKRLAFLRSPYIEVSQDNVPRAMAKRQARAGIKQTQDSKRVYTVKLRRVKHTGPTHNERGEPIERDSRWWVQGHYRAQWYPSKKSHEVIWIASHLKGPQDKPIKEKVYHVAR